MNFKGHAIAGVASGALVGLAVSTLEPDPFWGERTTNLADFSIVFFQGISLRIDIFILTLFMSLFPDIDTASISQRWFFRLCVLSMGVLLYHRALDIFIVVAFTALLPLLHKHRGWTHWKITPWVLAFSFMIILEYLRSKTAWFSGFSWQNVWDLLKENTAYITAMVVGHYTHLSLDSKWMKRVPFYSKGKGHR